MSLESEILSLSAYIKECWNEAIKKKAELETKYPQHNLSALCCAISELDASETVVVPEKYSTSFVFDGNLHPKTNQQKVFKAPWYTSWMKQTLTEVNLNGITSITGNFKGFVKLSSIQMDSLETVGSSNLFNSVASLRIAKMNSVKALKGNDFRVSDKRVPTVLSEVQLNSLQEMKGYTFMSCYNLSNVVIPNVTKIGNNNFAYCLNLSSIDMSKCSKIGTGNFLCCGISSLNISSYNGHLASGLLSGASHLREVFVGDMSKKQFDLRITKCPSGLKGVELSVYIASGMASMVPKAPNCRCYKDGDKNTGGDYRTIRLIAMDGSYPDPTAKPWKNFLAKRPESNKSKMSPIAFGNSEPTP